MKGFYKALENIVWLTQLGLSMLLPLLALTAGCWWAVGHWNWPVWVYIPAILLGIACGANVLYRFGRMMKNKKSENDRTGFNIHE